MRMRYDARGFPGKARARDLEPHLRRPQRGHSQSEWEGEDVEFNARIPLVTIVGCMMRVWSHIPTSSSSSHYSTIVSHHRHPVHSYALVFTTRMAGLSAPLLLRGMML